MSFWMIKWYWITYLHANHIICHTIVWCGVLAPFIWSFRISINNQMKCAHHNTLGLLFIDSDQRSQGLLIGKLAKQGQWAQISHISGGHSFLFKHPVKTRPYNTGLAFFSRAGLVLSKMLRSKERVKDKGLLPTIQLDLLTVGCKGSLLEDVHEES